MVKPLYPLSDISPDKRKRLKDAKLAKEKARKEFILQIVKNPYLVSAALVIIILISVVFIHTSNSKKTLDTSSDSGKKNKSGFSWNLSKVFTNEKPKDIGTVQQEQLKQMGIDDNVESFEVKVVAKDLREERKILAMRKYEASRQTAERRIRDKEEQRQKLNSNKSLRLKEAVMAAQDSNMLGIMKLEDTLVVKTLTQTFI